MKKQYLILGIHNHQPIGNFDFVFEGCYQKAYAPFWEILKKHPSIKISIHYSGTLWNWFLENSSSLVDIVTEMLHRGQIELLSGGFYEPILPILPDADKVGQIKKFNRFLNDRFHTNPRGMWLAERVWEPHLVKYICEAGIEYLAVDDLHFRSAGLHDEDLWGYYLTEEQGALLKVFPGCKYLRYTIPFKPPQVTIDYLLNAPNGGGNLRVMADDGEKFGVWPGTYDLVYNQGWLDQFLTLIEENQDKLETITFSEYLDRFPPLGRIYLPTASYSEMEEWALPTQSAEEFIALERMIDNTTEFANVAKPFLKGGFWRNFLTKYSESNNLYRKMLWVSKQITDCQTKVPKGESQEEWLKQAQDELWKGQCNDAYWHGLFGGLYLPHLRDGVYNHLIQAENIIDQKLHPAGNWIDCLSVDMDGDGIEEILVKTPSLNFWLDADKGGALIELDYRPKAFNLINSLMRRKETYHQKLLQCSFTDTDQENGYGDGVKSIHEITVSKDKDLSELLYYDQYARTCLLDHFLAPDTTLQEFSRIQHQEYGDFITGNYQKQIQSTEEDLHVTLSRDGSLSIGKKHIPFRVKKMVRTSADKSELAFEYQVTNLGKSPVQCKFGVEFNINLLAGRSNDRYYQVPGVILEDRQLASWGALDNVEQIQLVDEALGLCVSLDFVNHPTIWRFPIETASNSESGFERVYQSSVILPHWDLRLGPKDVWICHFRLHIADLGIRD